MSSTTITTTSTTVTTTMESGNLSPPTPSLTIPSAKKRGHAHRRSAAISGDFDSMGITFMNSASTTPSFSPSRPSTFKFGGTSSSEDQNTIDSTLTTTLVPNKDFSFPNVQLKNNISVKKSDISLNTKYSVDSFTNEVSSTETTPENANNNNNNNNNNNHNNTIDADELNNRLSQSSKFYLSTENNEPSVPSAIIDLDAALDFNFYDDNSNTKSKRSHRRTESAPEFDYTFGGFSPNFPSFDNRFNNNKLTISTSGNSNGLGLYSNIGSRKSFFSQLSPATDVPIVEEEDEEEEEDEDIKSDIEPEEFYSNSLSKKPSIYSNEFSATSSASLNKESNSLHSESSTANSTDELKKYTSTSPKFNNILQPPAPIGTRRGRTAARYQNHYDNSKMIIDALRSTESLNMIGKTESNTKEINHKLSLPVISSQKSKNIKISKSLSPTRFNFEPIVYDIAEKPFELLKNYQSKPINNLVIKSEIDSRPSNEEEFSDYKSNNSYNAETSMSSIGGSINDEIENFSIKPINHHRKSHSIGVTVNDDFSQKITNNKSKFYKIFGNNNSNNNNNNNNNSNNNVKQIPPRIVVDSTNTKTHRRKSSILNSLQQFLTTPNSNPSTSASSTRTIIMNSNKSNYKKKSSPIDSEFDSLISTPILKRIGTHSRNNSETPLKINDESQLSVQTLTQNSQIDLTITHPSLKKKISEISLVSKNEYPEKSLFGLNTKSTLSLNNLLKTPKRKSDDNGSIISINTFTNKNYKKIFNWLKGNK